MKLYHSLSTLRGVEKWNFFASIEASMHEFIFHIFILSLLFDVNVIWFAVSRSFYYDLPTVVDLGVEIDFFLFSPKLLASRILYQLTEMKPNSNDLND